MRLVFVTLRCYRRRNIQIRKSATAVHRSVACSIGGRALLPPPLPRRSRMPQINAKPSVCCSPHENVEKDSCSEECSSRGRRQHSQHGEDYKSTISRRRRTTDVTGAMIFAFTTCYVSNMHAVRVCRPSRVPQQRQHKPAATNRKGNTTQAIERRRNEAADTTENGCHGFAVSSLRHRTADSSRWERRAGSHIFVRVTGLGTKRSKMREQ